MGLRSQWRGRSHEGAVDPDLEHREPEATHVEIVDVPFERLELDEVVRVAVLAELIEVRAQLVARPGHLSRERERDKDEPRQQDRARDEPTGSRAEGSVEPVARWRARAVAEQREQQKDKPGKIGAARRPLRPQG